MILLYFCTMICQEISWCHECHCQRQVFVNSKSCIVVKINDQNSTMNSKFLKKKKKNHGDKSIIFLLSLVTPIEKLGVIKNMWLVSKVRKCHCACTIWLISDHSERCCQSTNKNQETWATLLLFLDPHTGYQLPAE